MEEPAPALLEVIWIPLLTADAVTWAVCPARVKAALICVAMSVATVPAAAVCVVSVTSTAARRLPLPAVCWWRRQ